MVRRIPILALGVLLMLTVLTTSFAPVERVAAAHNSTGSGKITYFQNATAIIGGNPQYLMNTSLPTAMAVIPEFTTATVTYRWFLDPPLAGDLTLNGTVRSFLWVRFLDAKGSGTTFLTMGIGLYAHKGGFTTILLNEGDATNKRTHSFVTSHFSEYEVSGQITPGSTVANGSRLEVVILLESNQAVTKRIAWGSENFRSRVSLPAVTHLQVEDIRALNATGEQPAYLQVDDNVTFNATIMDPFGGYDIVWVNLTLEALGGPFLFNKQSMVQTSGNATSLASTFELNWPEVPKTKGGYNVTVEAVDRTGYHFRYPDRPGDETFGGHLESLTVLLSVGEVTWANFVLEDSTSQPLEGARLELWDVIILAASGVANATGRVNLTNIPGAGNYTARAWWQDVVVLEAAISINGSFNEDAPMVLTLGVYSPTLRIVDSAGVPLGEATVFLTHPNGTTFSIAVITDTNGTLALSRTAGGLYTLRITWSGTSVGEKSVLVASNDLQLVQADVFYLTVRTLDQANATVAGVHLVVTDLTRALIADSKLTDPAGLVRSRLPQGQYRLEANWLGASVGRVNSLDLTGDATLDLRLTIFNVGLTLVDQQGDPLEAATVEVGLEGFKAGGTTDADGQLTLQLPGGNLALKAWWRDVLVFDGTQSVGPGNTTLRVTTQVFHIPVKVMDKDGRPLAGVTLTLYRQEAAVDGGITGADGTYTFRQPVGSYRVVARLDTTYLLTKVDLTAETSFNLPADGDVEVRFVEFTPPLTSTNLFYVLVGVGAGVALLGVFLFKLRRRGGGSKEAPESTTEDVQEPE